MVHSGRSSCRCFGFLLRQKSTRRLAFAEQRLGDFHNCHHTTSDNLGRRGGIYQRLGLPVLGFRLPQTGS